jgi:hypothetical protein
MGEIRFASVRILHAGNYSTPARSLLKFHLTTVPLLVYFSVFIAIFHGLELVFSQKIILKMMGKAMTESLIG